MDFGALMFFTDYAIPATELAQALEARGFEFGLGARAFAHPDLAHDRRGRAAASCRRCITRRWTRSCR